MASSKEGCFTCIGNLLFTCHLPEYLSWIFRRTHCSSCVRTCDFTFTLTFKNAFLPSVSGTNFYEFQTFLLHLSHLSCPSQSWRELRSCSGLSFRDWCSWSDLLCRPLERLPNKAVFLSHLQRKQWLSDLHYLTRAFRSGCTPKAVLCQCTIL